MTNTGTGVVEWGVVQGYRPDKAVVVRENLKSGESKREMTVRGTHGCARNLQEARYCL